MKIGLKQKRRYRRHKRVRAKIYGTARMPRLCVFRPAKHIYAQLIDDEKGMTLASASDRELKKPKIKNKKPKIKIKKEKIKEPQIVLTPTKVAIAYEVGKLIAKKAKNLPAACLSGRQGRHGVLNFAFFYQTSQIISPPRPSFFASRLSTTPFGVEIIKKPRPERGALISWDLT